MWKYYLLMGLTTMFLVGAGKLLYSPWSLIPLVLGSVCFTCAAEAYHCAATRIQRLAPPPASG